MARARYMALGSSLGECDAGAEHRHMQRSMRYAMRHADLRTTMRYDAVKADLHRHAAHAVAATSPGMSTG